jgi:hypothetical protein
MRFMLTLIGPEGGWEDITPEEMGTEMKNWEAFGKGAVEAGAFIAGDGLQPSTEGKTVRGGRDENRVVTDGPFAESKEQIGGFYLLECKDMDEALGWAKRVPIRAGAIEVRPVMDYSEYGYDDPAEAGATPVRSS